jgi:hypothetical protein
MIVLDDVGYNGNHVVLNGEQQLLWCLTGLLRGLAEDSPLEGTEIAVASPVGYKDNILTTADGAEFFLNSFSPTATLTEEQEIKADVVKQILDDIENGGYEIF